MLCLKGVGRIPSGIGLGVRPCLLKTVYTLAAEPRHHTMAPSCYIHDGGVLLMFGFMIQLSLLHCRTRDTTGHPLFVCWSLAAEPRHNTMAPINLWRRSGVWLYGIVVASTLSHPRCHRSSPIRLPVLLFMLPLSRFHQGFPRYHTPLLYDI